MATIDDVRRLVALDHGLASLSTVRLDGSVHATVVNAGVVDHPVTGTPVAAFVARPGTLKLRHLRQTPAATLSWRAGWAWCTAEGTTTLFGPDDPLPKVAPGTLAVLLRTIYSAAGGSDHEDWAEYDRAMVAEGRVAVLVSPTRIYVNP